MKPKIAFVAEAWGAEEARARTALVGASGWCFNGMLDEAGIRRADCFLTNVFNLKPEPTNDISNLCGDRAEGAVSLGPLTKGKYLRREYLGELDRLQRELNQLRPNVIVALGNTAAWALLGSTGISKIRGTITEGKPEYGNPKVLPTFHPAAVLRDWSLRPVTIIDLKKAARESEFPEIRRPKCWVWIEPTLEDMERFYVEHLEHAPYISFDIETRGDQITCIGFAPSRELAIVVPFVDDRNTAPESRGSYWRTQQDESLAWAFVRRVLSNPSPKFGQNTLYDIHFLWKKYGLTVNNYTDDTMLLSHALQPESQKGLGFLGSIYTDHSSWKTMRTKVLTIKKDA